MKSMSPALFGSHWLPILTQRLPNIRFLVESALWITESSGRDTSDELRAALLDIQKDIPDLQRRLQALAEDKDDDLANASTIALQVMEGSRFPR